MPGALYPLLAACDLIGTLFFAAFVNWWAPLFIVDGDLPRWLKWAASDQAIFAVAETHRAAMEASADPASYDYSAGWPKIYGE